MDESPQDRQRVLEEQIRLANHLRYEDGEVVETFFQDPHHVLRLSLAIQLLKEGIDRSFPHMPPGKIKILEIGSSTGRVAKQLVEAQYDVTASDIEAPALEAARLQGLHCVQFDAAQQFPFDDGAFHAILVGELIEHLFDTDRFLSECNRVLRDSGILVITTPNLAGLQDRLGFLIGRAPRQVNPLHEYIRLHIRPFTPPLLRDVLIHKGFEVKKIRSSFVVIRLSAKKHLNLRFIARVFPHLGKSLIVLACKAKEPNAGPYPTKGSRV